MKKKFLLFAALAALLVCPQQVAASVYNIDISTCSQIANNGTWTNKGDYYELYLETYSNMISWNINFDASNYDYLVVELAEATSNSCSVCLFNAETINGTYSAQTDIKDGGTTIKVKLSDCTIDGSNLDKSNITIVGFQTWTNDITLNVKSIYFATADEIIFDFSTASVATYTNLDVTSTVITVDGVTALTQYVNSEIGWEYSGLNLSTYRGINLEFDGNIQLYANGSENSTDATYNVQFRIYGPGASDSDNSYFYPLDIHEKTSAIIDLTSNPTGKKVGDETAESTVDLSKITKINFWSMPYDYGTTDGDGNYTAKGANYTVTKITDLSLIPMTYSLTVPATGYATYCPKYGMDFSSTESIKAYTATVNTDKSALELKETTYVPAGKGVILYCDGGATESVPTTLSEVTLSNDNDLVGTLTEITNITDAYILATVNSTTGFYLAGSNCTVPAGKAYLDADKVSSVKSLSIVFADDDDTTGISTVATSEAGTAVKTIYNLAGQRLSAPQKGLNIINGKKVIIK